MALKFCTIRGAIDIFRNRLPGALAMLKATDASISIHHRADGTHDCTVTYHFDQNVQAATNAYHAVERLYEMERPQCR